MRSMKSLVAPMAMLAMLAAATFLPRTAHAQGSATLSAQDYETGYVEGLAQSAFGNVTSQSFGAEGGIYALRHLSFFAEFGYTRDTAPDSLGARAQIIAGYLSQIQPAPVTYQVRQPVWFFQGGVRYAIPYSEKIEPYVVGGAGVASVKHDVRFTVGGTDVTDALATYFVALGSDLSGSETAPTLTFGGGVVWNYRRQLFFDANYRFGHLFTNNEGTTINRLGVGVGTRF